LIPRFLWKWYQLFKKKIPQNQLFILYRLLQYSPSRYLLLSLKCSETITTTGLKFNVLEACHFYYQSQCHKKPPAWTCTHVWCLISVGPHNGLLHVTLLVPRIYGYCTFEICAPWSRGTSYTLSVL
jgi:hypothetical protein